MAGKLDAHVHVGHPTECHQCGCICQSSTGCSGPAYGCACERGWVVVRADCWVADYDVLPNSGPSLRSAAGGLRDHSDVTRVQWECETCSRAASNQGYAELRHQVLSLTGSHSALIHTPHRRHHRRLPKLSIPSDARSAPDGNHAEGCNTEPHTAMSPGSSSHARRPSPGKRDAERRSRRPRANRWTASSDQWHNESVQKQASGRGS